MARAVAGESRTALAALTAVEQQGAILWEDRRQGQFVYDASDLSDLVTADTAQGIYIPPASDPTGASGAWVRQYDGPVNPRWFGAVGDDVTDDGPAFLAALNTLFAQRMTGTQYGYGRGSGALRIPASARPYYLGDTTLDITHNLLIEGFNGGGAAGGSTVLRWDDGVTGIRTQLYNTEGPDGPLEATSHLGAAQTLIRNLMLIGGYSGTESESHGIHLRAVATIRDVMIKGFSGDGVHSNVALGSATDAGNSNGTQVDNVFVTQCRDGFHIEQVDANAWTMINPHANSNRRYGFWKKTTLGGTIIGGLSETNGMTEGYTSVVSHLGKWFYVLPGQEAGASTNSPPATATNNTWWAYMVGHGGITATTPQWVSGMTLRAGGALRVEGSYEQNMFVGMYVEGDQPPPLIEASAKAIWLCPMGGHPRMFNGAFYAASMTGSGSEIRINGGLHVGSADLGTPAGSHFLDVDNDVRLTRPAGIVWDPTLHIDTTNSYATVQFSRFGTAKGYVQHGNGLGQYYIVVDDLPHLFYSNAVNSVNIDKTGILLQAGKVLKVNGTQVVGAQGAAIANATDAASAITQLNLLLAAARTHGLIAT